MARQTLERKVSGLYSLPNPYTAPEGALLEAKNVMVDRDGVLEKARGFNRYGDELSNTPSGFLQYQDQVVVLDGSTLKYDSDGAGTWASWSGSFSPPSGYQLRGREIRSNLYFPTSDGVYKNDSISNDPVKAGLPKALHSPAFVESNILGFLGTEKKVSYRYIFVRTDANGFELRSAPSPRIIVSNTSSTDVAIVDLRLRRAPNVLSTDRIRLYRTPEVALASDPGDAHYLVREVVVGTVQNSVQIEDDLDEAFLGEELYTNPTQQTISQANDPPPFAHDIATFKGYTFYARTRQPHEVKLRIVDLDKITTSATITVKQGAQNYTFTLSPSTSEATEAQNIEETLKDLVADINLNYADGSVPFYADYEHIETVDLPSLRLVWGDTSATGFVVTASSDAVGAGFDPPLTEASDDADVIESTQEQGAHRLYRSKLEEPDAVPRGNSIPVGSEESPILRIISTRQTLWILKEEGIFRLTGETEYDFIVDEFDPSVRILGPNTAVALNNSVYTHSNQGVVRVNEAGVAIVSRPDEIGLDEVEKFTNFTALAFGVGHEELRRYWIFHPSAESDSYCRVARVYNHLTEAWTTREKDVQAGVLLMDEDRLYLAHAVDKYVLKERRDLALTDYVDEDIPVTVIEVSTWTKDGVALSRVTLDYSYHTAPAVGWMFRYGTQEAHVEAVTDNGNGTYTLDLNSPLSLPTLEDVQGGFFDLLSIQGLRVMPTGEGGSSSANFPATLQISIASRVEWVPEVAGNPAQQKHFMTSNVSFETSQATKHSVGFFSDYVGLEQKVETESGSAGFGYGKWGQFPWGGSGRTAGHMRVPVPLEYQRCRAISLTFEHDLAQQSFAILTTGFYFRPLGERTSRDPR